jgi:pyruvate/2-oxoglutarate dehydrogenase complex dihydrolipoamide dehydrogenase (E3) component
MSNKARVSDSGNGFKMNMIPEILVKYKQDGEVKEMIVETVLFSMGRVPNVEGMGCD